MISENDYTFMDNEKYPEHHCIRIKTGMYKDVIYAYGRVKAVVEDNDDIATSKNSVVVIIRVVLKGDLELGIPNWGSPIGDPQLGIPN